MPLDQIIFPKDCGKTQENKEITTFLREKASDGNVYISTNDDCGGAKGVFLWLAKLTPSHVDEISKLLNVEAVELNEALKAEIPEKVSDSNPDDFLQMSGSDGPFDDDHQEVIGQEIPVGKNSENIAESISPPGPSTPKPYLDEASDANAALSNSLARSGISRLEKRSMVFRQQKAPPHLVFISTPISRATANEEVDYLYPESDSNKRITIYIPDSGANPGHKDFGQSKVIKKWLYGVDLPQQQRTPTDFDGHGTCALSVICGLENGVFKDPDVVVGKMSYTIGGYLVMLRAILNDLIGRVNNPNSGPIQGPIKGYTVLALQGGLASAKPASISRLRQTMKIFIEIFEVVVVAPAGNDARYDRYRYITDYPAKLARSFPIITVGAVDLSSGKTSSYSQGGPALTVGGPGVVQCASRLSPDDTVVKDGTSFASAAAAGLVAALLNDPMVGDLLRKSPLGVVAAVKACIVELAQERSPGIKSIWNGVDFRKKENFGWPPRNLRCLQGNSASLDDSLDAR